MRSAIFAAPLLFVALAGCAGPRAATVAPPGASQAAAPLRVVVLVQTQRHLELALRTGQELLSRAERPAERIEVVVCGDEVRALVAGGPVEPALADAAARGVDVAACGLSLERAGLRPDQLSPHVRVVANGLLEVVERAAEGWIHVEL